MALGFRGAAMKRPPRFVAVDLDGTVLIESVGLTPRTLAAFKALKAGGIIPLVATGRPRKSALRWVEALGADSGLVCHNGAVVYDAQARIVAETTIPEPTARRLIEESRHIEVHFHGFAGDEWLFELERPGTARYERRAAFPGRRVSFDSLPRLGFHKAMFVGSDEEAVYVTDRIRQRMGPLLEVYPTGSGFVELVAPGIGKGKSLSRLVESLGGSMEEVIAFGDAWNDEDMLLMAGIGVAMGNAPEELKSRVGLSTGSVQEDGVAAWLEEHFSLAT